MTGGNLFWNPKGEHEEGKELINLKTGSTVIVSGDVPHCPEIIQHGYNIYSNDPQERKLIVFFFKDLERNDPKDIEIL